LPVLLSNRHGRVVIEVVSGPAGPELRGIKGRRKIRRQFARARPPVQAKRFEENCGPKALRRVAAGRGQSGRRPGFRLGREHPCGADRPSGTWSDGARPPARGAKPALAPDGRWIEIHNRQEAESFPDWWWCKPGKTGGSRCGFRERERKRRKNPWTDSFPGKSLSASGNGPGALKRPAVGHVGSPFPVEHRAVGRPKLGRIVL